MEMFNGKHYVYGVGIPSDMKRDGHSTKKTLSINANLNPEY